jgi:hypothetical protein
MLKTVAKLLPNNIKGALKQFHIFQDFSTRSYAQEGEDLLLARCLAYRDMGFYVDIGAHHPKRFSNTYLFYRRGWCGINIGAMPGSMSQFRRVRPRDIIPMHQRPSMH